MTIQILRTNNHVRPSLLSLAMKQLITAGITNRMLNVATSIRKPLKMIESQPDVSLTLSICHKANDILDSISRHIVNRMVVAIGYSKLSLVFKKDEIN